MTMTKKTLKNNIWKPDTKKSGFQINPVLECPDFECLLYPDVRYMKIKPGLRRGDGDPPPKTKSLLFTYATAGECLAKYMSGREVQVSDSVRIK